MLAGDMRPARPPCISSDRAWARPHVFDAGRADFTHHVCCNRAQQHSYGTASTSDRADAAAMAIRAAASLADMERAVMQHWQDMDSTSAHHAFVCMYKILNKQQKYKQKAWRNAAWRPSRPIKPLQQGSRIQGAPHMGPNVRSRVHIPMDLYDSDEHSSSQPTGSSREATAQKLPGQTDTASSSSTISSGMQANQTSRKRSSNPGQPSSMGTTADRDPQAELSSMQRLLPLMLYKAGPLQQANEYACVHMVIVLGLAHKARVFGPSPSSSVPPVPPPQAAAAPPTSRSAAHHRGQAPSLPPLDYASAADVADTLAAAAVPQLLDFSPDCLSKLLLGLAYLELDPGADWLGLASAALISRCQRMSGWQAAATVHAFSLIGFKPHPALLHDLVKRIQQRVDQLLPKQQAVLLQSLARMGFKPRPTWLRVFVQASISKLSGLSILMLANMVEAFGQMRYQPPPMWLKAMFRCSLGVLHLAPQRDAAALLYWVCRHNIAMPPGWLHETLLQARGVRCWPPATLLNRGQQIRGQQAEPQGQGSSEREQLGDKRQGLQEGNYPQEQAGWYPGLQRPQLLTQGASPTHESGGLPMRNNPPSSSRSTDGNEVGAAAQLVVAAHVNAATAAKGLDTRSLVQLLYMIAKERDDSRVAVHVTWAIKQLKALLRAEASNAKHTHRRRRNKAAINTGQVAVGASSDAASAGREGCAGDAGAVPVPAEASGTSDAASAAINTGHGAMGGSADAASAGREGCAGDAGAVPVPAEASGTSDAASAAINTGHGAMGGSADAASAGREGCAGDAGAVPVPAEASGTSDAASAAINTGHGAMGGSADAASAGREGCAGDAGAVPVPAEASGTSDAASAAINTGHGAMGGSADAASAGREGCAGDAGAVPVPAEASGTSDAASAALNTGHGAMGGSADAASVDQEGCPGDAGAVPVPAEDSGTADAASAAPVPSSASHTQENATGAVSTPSASSIASTACTARPSAATATAAAPLSELSPQLLVDLLYVMAELGQQPPTAARRSLMTRLQAAMPSFTTNNCTTAMVCLAVLNITPEAAWEEAFFARVLQLMATFKPQELANVLTAAGYLYLDPGQPLLAAVAARLSAFDLVELAMFVRKLEQATAPPKRSGSAAVLGTDWLLGLKRSAKRMFAAKA